MNITDEMLMAYADGELDAATREQIEREVAENPALAKQVAQYRDLRTQLSSAFDSVLNEPVPDRLHALLATPTTSISDLEAARRAKAEKKGRNSGSFQWMSIAASVIAGVLIGIFAFGDRDNSVIVASKAGLLASGELARGLTEELASRPNKQSMVQIGVSYLAKSGEYCRTFVMTSESNIAGLGCRTDNDWRISMLMRSEKATASTYRTAASAMPAEVLAAVTENISGEPLDASSELHIAKQGWKSAK